jgi:ADP-ribose pyrophosphatase
MLEVDLELRRRKVLMAKSGKTLKSDAAKGKTAKAAKTAVKTRAPKAKAREVAEILSSKVVFECRLFKVRHDTIIEPSGQQVEKDVIRHNGSAVILAVDNAKSKRDPWIVLERQYRHAANQYLWEIPAGKLEPGEDALEGAKRELEEETGYRAKKWKPLVEYYASPGFLGESMKVFLAEGLTTGQTNPDEDEQIEVRLVKLSEVLKMIDKGAILDGKTLTTVLLYARKLGQRKKK